MLSCVLGTSKIEFFGRKGHITFELKDNKTKSPLSKEEEEELKLYFDEEILPAARKMFSQGLWWGYSCLLIEETTKNWSKRGSGDNPTTNPKRFKPTTKGKSKKGELINRPIVLDRDQYNLKRVTINRRRQWVPVHLDEVGGVYEGPNDIHMYMNEHDGPNTLTGEHTGILVNAQRYATYIKNLQKINFNALLHRGNPMLILENDTKVQLGLNGKKLLDDADFGHCGRSNKWLLSGAVRPGTQSEGRDRRN